MKDRAVGVIQVYTRGIHLKYQCIYTFLTVIINRRGQSMQSTLPLTVAISYRLRRSPQTLSAYIRNDCCKEKCISNSHTFVCIHGYRVQYRGVVLKFR